MPIETRSRSRRSTVRSRSATTGSCSRSAPSRGRFRCPAWPSLPGIPARRGGYAAAQLARRGVGIHVSARLESADSGGVLLSDGTRVETSTLVWTAGVRANPFLAELGLPLDERGRLVVDE